MTEDFCRNFEEKSDLDLVVRLYDDVLARIEARWAEYEKECEEWAAQGFRPERCIHGTYLWTDYDPICGECEQALDKHEQAIMSALWSFADFQRRLVGAYAFMNLVADEGDQPAGYSAGAIYQWAAKPIAHLNRSHVNKEH